MPNSWTVRDIPNQHGKVIVITGANSGVGYESALALAGKGAQVILAVRNRQKGMAALNTIQGAFPKSTAEVLILDLASLESVHGFVEQFQREYERLDVLLNNAGMMATPFYKTVDGFEMQFGINHLGHFALTGLLLPTLLKTPNSRVVTVSSINHNFSFSGIDFDNLDASKGYRKWTAYNQSKLSNLLFAYELERKLESVKADVISVGVHPGYTATNLQSAGPRLSGSQFIEVMYEMGNILFGQSAAMGALPLLYASVAPSVKGGDYIGPRGIFGMWGSPKIAKSNGRSHELEAAKRLWEVSEQLARVHYQLQR
jgi:NAD(P)-dependent dehydrogenase (short-subunit alcohol dehydrogenase family)